MTTTYYKDKVLASALQEVAIYYEPKMLSIAIQAGLDRRTQDVCNHIDFFTFHFRRHIGGYTKTTHRVYYEVRKLLAFDKSETAILMLCCMMCDAYIDLQKNELYEVMPACRKTASKVVRLIKQITNTTLLEKDTPEYLIGLINRKRIELQTIKK